MTRFPQRRLWLFVALFAAGGCVAPATDPRYPSLLPRPIEARSDAEPEVAPTVAKADPALDGKVAAWRKTLDETAAAFTTAAASAERAALAARGDAVGGERWLTAQSVIADLDALRATTSATLTEIDDRAIARASDGEPPYPALKALRDDGQAAAEAQDARITALSKALPGT